MPLGEPVIAAIAETLSGAPRAHRAFLVGRLADTYGVSVATVYRAAKLGGPKRNRDAQRPEYRDWARIAVRIAERAPKRIPLDLAIESGVASGALPAEAADMPIATAHRVVRELGLQRRPKRSFRLSAERPMQTILIDGSTSQYLTVGEDLGGGDYLLKLHRAPYPASGYKNKPLGPDRLRVVVYGIWDMCTGTKRGIYVPALGENAVDCAESLCVMLAETGDPARPMHGVPANLWSDKGPLIRGRATADLLDRLGIHVPEARPYAKERMGGIERTWRTLWARFERTLFLRAEDTIALSALHERLEEYERRENGLRLSRTPVAGRPASRTAAWIALTNSRPADNPLRKLPSDPMRTLVREAHRTVNACGIVTWGGAEYECSKFHHRRVLLRRSLEDADTLLAIDEATKETDTARVWTPRPHGEIRTAPKTELERLVEEDAENPVPVADPYAPRPSAPNVVAMPVRSAPAAPLEDPMAAADRYGSLEEALQAFVQICTLAVWAGMSEAYRARIAQRIEELGLDRAAVAELAQQVALAAYGESA